MKILIVGGKQFKHEAERYYSYVNKLINGFVRAGHHVQHISDRDTARNSNFFKRKKMGIKSCNQTIIDYVTAYMPDVIIFKHADVIETATLTHIREEFPHIKMAQLNVDALFNPDNVERIRSKSGHVDASFITTAGKALEKCKNNGKPLYYIPNIVDTSIESYQAFKQNNEYDIFFACGAAYDGELRKEIKNYVADELPQAKMSYHCVYEKSALWGHDYMNRVGNSTMGLNFSRYDERGRRGEENDFYMYSSDRLAHYIGNGLLVFSDNKFCLDKLYTQDEMVFFDSKEELMQKLKYYLEHVDEARNIAKSGWEKSVTEYNSTKAAEYILDVLYKGDLSKYKWPTEAI